jgi:hypothetical protein
VLVTQVCQSVLSKRPIGKLSGIADELAMFVEAFGMKGRHHEVPIKPVHTSGVAMQALTDGFAVPQFLQHRVWTWLH